MDGVVEDVEWGTEDDGIAGRFKDSLVKRARKRDIHLSTDNSWVVLGNESLSDKYPYYIVSGGGDGMHTCTCQQHTGGEYRNVCSHIIGVLLKKEEMGWEPTGKSSDAATTATEPSSETGPSSSTTSTDVRTEDWTFETDPRDSAWGYPAFPDWVSEFRPHQLHAIEDILDAYDRGAKVVFVDAPTGSGKTLIAEAVRRVLSASALYTCTTKTLQDQFVEDYTYAALLKGRDNYPTMYASFPDVTAGDCTGPGCDWCDSVEECAYTGARDKARNSSLAVLNTAYALTTWNFVNQFVGRGLVILDECDLLEGSLMGFVEVRISEWRQRKHGIEVPARNPYRRVDADLEWIDRTLPVVSGELARIPDGTRDVRLIRDRKWLSGLMGKLNTLKDGLTLNQDGDETATKWVYDLERKKHIVFKPVEVHQFGQRYVWRHAQRFLMMSASIVSAQEMAASLGLAEDEWEVVKVESTFPAENRPVKVAYAGRVTSKTYDDVIGDVAKHVQAIIDAHPGERMLVHTVSYKMANDILTRVSADNIMTYANAGQREEVLRWMKETPGAVVLAPSFDRGVDLPGDLCKVQVIAKVPYPYLGDKQVNARLHMGWRGQLWYNAQTVRTLIQMTGRGVRSKDDSCVTYILDRQFHDFYRKNKRLFPAWWKEALDLTGRAKSELGVQR